MRRVRVVAACIAVVAAAAVPAACVSSSAPSTGGEDGGYSFDSAVLSVDTGSTTADAPADVARADAVSDAPSTGDASDAGNPTDASDAGNADAADASEDATTLSTGLLAWYRAEGNANDSTGNFNGTLFGQDDASVTFVAGRDGGQAFSFPGANAEVNIPSGILPYGATSYTIAVWAWINPAALTGAQYQIAYTGSLTGERFLSLDSNNEIDFSVHVASGGYPGAYSSVLDASTATGVWLPVVAVRRDATLELWIGGTLSGSTTIGDDAGLYVDDAGTSSSIGGKDGTNFYWGYLDDIRFWGRALSPAEIQSL
jgi:hypothetical protein